MKINNDSQKHQKNEMGIEPDPPARKPRLLPLSHTNAARAPVFQAHYIVHVKTRTSEQFLTMFQRYNRFAKPLFWKRGC